jgi:Ca-activated chloride channel family protein
VRNITYADILKLMDQIPTPLSKRADVTELRLLIEKARKLDSRKDKFAKAVPVAQMDFDKVPVIK